MKVLYISLETFFDKKVARPDDDMKTFLKLIARSTKTRAPIFLDRNLNIENKYKKKVFTSKKEVERKGNWALFTMEKLFSGSRANLDRFERNSVE